jgi:hypothetical protein
VLGWPCGQDDPFDLATKVAGAVWLAIAFKIAASAFFAWMTWRILRGPSNPDIDQGD